MVMSDIERVVIWGGSGQCAVVTDILRETGIAVAAIFDNDVEMTRSYTGLSVRHGRSSFESWMEDKQKRGDHDKTGCIAAVAGVRSGVDRLELTDLMMDWGLVPMSVIHRTATISSDVEIALSAQLMANTFVGTGVKIGRCCILNSGSSLDHNSTLGAGVHMAPKAVVTGEVVIGDYSFIGSNATILPKIKVGVGCVVGAGAVVTRDVLDGETVIGIPARAV